MKQRFGIGMFFLYRLLRPEMSCRYVGTVSIFRRHRRPPAARVLFLPQKPYLGVDKLRDQLTYLAQGD